MSKFENELIKRIIDIQSIVEVTLNQQDNFTVKTKGPAGITCTHDRENYLQFGLEAVFNELQDLLENIQYRAERKTTLKTIK